MDLGLSDSTFVITGGTRGLGLATARTLVTEGANTVLVGRDPLVGTAAADGLGTRARFLTGDLTDPDCAAEAVASARQATGRCDGALISAGGPPAGRTLDLSDTQWRDAFESVFLGALRVIRAIVDDQANPRDESNPTRSIVLVLSSSAKSPIPGLSASNGLRPGLAMLVKDLSDQYAKDEVRINGLLPGRLDTERVQSLDELADDPGAARAANARAIPMGRYGRPEEFGDVATFLLSPRASYVTGALIPVDGGASRSL